MFRTAALMAMAVAALRAGPATAQPDPQPKDDKVVIPLTLSPAAPPKPLSRYYLLPEYRDLQPGEKLSGFMKCFMEQSVFFNKENTEKRDKWLALPLAELPADAWIKNGIAYDPRYASLMVFMDQAARYTRTEWNEWFNLRHDGVYLLLPEVQQLRQLGRVLHLRLRGEVKNGEYLRAVVTVQSMLGLAKMLETHPTLIGNLVGMAVAAMAEAGLEELVQQPGCPNLFWSLADLPRPLISVRYGMSGERAFVTAQFQAFRDANRPLSEAEIEKQIKQFEQFLKDAGGMTVGPDSKPANPLEAFLKNPRVRFAMWAADKERVAAARKRLVEIGGLSPSEVKDYPPLQVVLTDELFQFEVFRDELMRWMNLPFPQSVGVERDEARLKDAKTDNLLAQLLTPGVITVKAAEARTQQRVAYLQVIEAVRLHALENGGKLPESLDAIKLPIPLDPVTGKPFSYTVKDGVATLTGGNSRPGNPLSNRVYEIRLRK